MSHHNLGTKLLCYWMLCALPGTLMGADKIAMLYGTGSVTVNANPVTHPSAVFAGDNIHTGSDSSVTLTFPGTQVNLPANSSIVYQPNQILMNQGSALLQARKGTVAHLAGLTIAPAGQSAKFQLTQVPGKVQVAALDGALTISDGLHRVSLPAGKEMSEESSASAPDSKSKGPDSSGSAPAPAVTGGLPGWVVGAIAAGVAGGVVGGLAAAGTFSSGRHPSPSQP